MHTQDWVFACREGEQNLAAASATPRIALLAFAAEGNLRFAVLGKWWLSQRLDRRRVRFRLYLFFSAGREVLERSERLDR